MQVILSIQCILVDAPLLKYMEKFGRLTVFSLAGKGAMAEVSTIVSVVKQYLPKADE